MTTLVTGASGQLGLEISRRFGRDGDVVAMTRAQLDITDHGAVLAAVARARPDVIVNCAAYNDVDGAETNPVTAMTVNGLAVRSLAAAARETGATLVHYSTDFVFDGQASRPYDECAEPAPQSVYASSKLLGEWFATGAPRHYVLRVESLFGGGAESPHPAGRRLGSTLDRIVDALLDGRPVKGFTDRTVSPSYVPDVAAATHMLVSGPAPVGLYHCVNGGLATWFEVAQVAASRLGCESLLSPVASGTVEMRAARPRFCALSNEKIVAAGASMPAWEDALDRYLAARRRTD
ncbi:MAG: dTDP-4-dehydrorhamnose reductase [Vicinamibacterales bacterium]|jgi:dTDP-4-dehydrorhamnose reductase|nr:dTDP-4-dehydrorhamnose reductase [Vicinamibacterales bacterium]